MAATREDAQLVLQLAQWGAIVGLDDAGAALFDDRFDPAAATVEDKNVRVILNFGKAVSTLVKHDLLDRGLVLDWWWMSGLWERVAPAARGLREKTSESRLYENFEALASG